MSNLRTTRASGNLPKTKLDQLKALHSQGKLEDALSLALALKADFPNSAVLHNILGVAQSQLELFNEAIESYQHAINLKPDFAAAFNNLGNAFREKGEFDKAFECFNQALEIKPNFAEAHNNLGNVFKSKGSLNKAIPSYRRAIELKPKYQEAHYNLGFALKEIGDFDNSVICYKNSLALKPDHAEAYNNLLRACLLKNYISKHRCVIGVCGQNLKQLHNPLALKATVSIPTHCSLWKMTLHVTACVPRSML
jgi:tetratricopeptide (TPR) repeat protein